MATVRSLACMCIASPPEALDVHALTDAGTRKHTNAMFSSVHDHKGGLVEETLCINSHHAANLNFPAKELRVRPLFWFL